MPSTDIAEMKNLRRKVVHSLLPKVWPGYGLTDLLSRWVVDGEQVPHINDPKCGCKDILSNPMMRVWTTNSEHWDRSCGREDCIFRYSPERYVPPFPDRTAQFCTEEDCEQFVRVLLGSNVFSKETKIKVHFWTLCFLCIRNKNRWSVILDECHSQWLQAFGETEAMSALFD